MLRRLAGLVFAFGLIGLARANAAVIERVGAPEKICQLTGDIDWESGKPTAARTYANFGLDAADLGYPIEHDGKLILLFGDSWPTMQKPGTQAEEPPNDAVGIVTRKEAPDSADCLGMTINDVAGQTMQIEGKGEALKIYQPATVVSPKPIQQGFFDVPTGGVSVGGALYGFFWADHCAKGHAVGPGPDPLARPAQKDDRCPEDDVQNSIGRGVMARSDDDGRTFHNAADLPLGFVYSIAVNEAAEKGVAETKASLVYIFGAPRYRASVPYLAEATVADFANPASWRFYAGQGGDGQPKWVDAKRWAQSYSAKTPGDWHPPAGAPEIFSADGGKEACVGEMSITWNKVLNKWLMLYNCHGIEARVADRVWGPWSEPATILDPGKDDVSCKLVMSAKGCGDRRDFWPSRRPDAKTVVSGGFYAPFVLNRYTQGSGGKAVVYWLLSTWNPYEVSVMRSTIAAH